MIENKLERLLEDVNTLEGYIKKSTDEKELMTLKYLYGIAVKRYARELTKDEEFKSLECENEDDWFN